MSLFELQPEYECLKATGGTGQGDAGDDAGVQEWVKCYPADFCGTETVYRVRQEASASLHNWVTTYGMECAAKYKFGLFGSLYFAAVVLGCLFFAPLADKIGRRPITLAGVALAALA